MIQHEYKKRVLVVSTLDIVTTPSTICLCGKIKMYSDNDYRCKILLLSSCNSYGTKTNKTKRKRILCVSNL